MRVDEERAFANEDVSRPVLYNGKVVPFYIAKMDQWSKDIGLWAKEQVYTKDESDGKVKRFPAHLEYFWQVDELLERFGLMIVPKTRRMMMTHYGLSVKMAHNLLFKPNSYNCVVSLREETAQTHLRDRTLFTLQHLDPRFPYPTLNEGRDEGIRSTAGSLINHEIGSSVHAYPSGSGKVRGMTVTFAFFDEWAHQDKQKENWTAVTPALEGANCKGMFVSSVEPGTYMEEVCNDVAPDAPFEVVAKGLNYTLNSKGACILGLNYRANPDKDPDTEKGRAWYARERKKYDLYTWLKEYEGMWRFPITGRVYWEYKKERHSKDWDTRKASNADGPIHIGYDPGFRYTSVCIGEVNTTGELCIDHSILCQNVNNEQFLEGIVVPYLNKRYGISWRGRDIWYIDPAGSGHNSHGGVSVKKTLRTILKHNRIYSPEKTSPKDRVNFINVLFGREKILVNPSCGEFRPEGGKIQNGIFIDMLEWGYQYKQHNNKGSHGDREPEKDGFWDQISDPFGYMIAHIFAGDIEKVKRNRLGKLSKDEKKRHSTELGGREKKKLNRKARFSASAKPRI